MEDKRRVLIKSNNSEWLEIEFKDLKKDNVCKLFEPTGELVVHKNRSEFTCLSDAFQGPHGPNKTTVWTVETDD